MTVSLTVTLSEKELVEAIGLYCLNNKGVDVSGGEVSITMSDSFTDGVLRKTAGAKVELEKKAP